MDEPQYIAIAPGLIEVPASAFVRVLEAVAARYEAVAHGTTPQHAEARAYFGGMLATAQWIAGLRAAPPLDAIGTDALPTHQDLIDLIPRAGLAVNRSRGGPRTLSEQWAFGVLTMLYYALGSEAEQDLPYRLGIR